MGDIGNNEELAEEYLRVLIQSERLVLSHISLSKTNGSYSLFTLLIEKQRDKNKDLESMGTFPHQKAYEKFTSQKI
ncbi:MAG: hypothetical protein LBV19_00380 [Streptococcaceae bacterium]|nr:hypothetical protein [Streptococcaceae bacterium]